MEHPSKHNPFFPVQHSILDETALAEWAVKRYALPGPATCRFLRQSMSDTYTLQARDRAYILKVSLRDRHPREAVEAEVDFLHALAAADVPVAQPLADIEGQCVQDLAAPEGTRFAVLFEAVEGAEPDDRNPLHCRMFGRAAALVHNAADRLPRPLARWRLDEQYFLQETLEFARPYLAHRMADFAYLRGLAEDIRAELLRLLPKEPPAYGLVHGDLHTGNARFDADGSLVLFDFDTCGYGWRIIDCGVFAASHEWMDLSQSARSERARVWADFLEGYGSVRSLSENELAAARLAAPMRHLELMYLVMRYRPKQIGTSWLDDGFFDWHMQWFREANSK